MSGRILKKTVRSVLKSQIRNKSMVQVAIRSVLWSYPFCCNISLCLSMQISGRTLKKIVWLVLETQLRNRCMVRSLIRKQWGVSHDLFLFVTLQQLWPSSFCITKAFLVAAYCFLFCRKNIEKQAVPMLCINLMVKIVEKSTKRKGSCDTSSYFLITLLTMHFFLNNSQQNVLSQTQTL